MLKEEIRRLLRNEERAAHVEGNTEYLKNVIVKVRQSVIVVAQNGLVKRACANKNGACQLSS